MFGKFILKNKGSISIFLTIILLPTIAFSGLIVDGARLNLAKSMASSAGDLTMNAALANYDSVVKDVYGLFAMSQAAKDPEKALKENLAIYFNNTLAASGIAPADSDGYTDKLLNQLSDWFSNPGGDKSFDNFMSFDTSDFNAKYVEGSSLADSGILKSQIVEYMKYRAPAGVGLSFIDSIASFRKISEQTEVVNKKLEADDALQEVHNAADDYYNALKDANAKVSSFKNNYSGLKSSVESYKSIYRDKVNANILLYLINEEEAPKYYAKKKTGADIEQNEYIYSFASLYDSNTEKDFDKAKDALSSLLSDLEQDTGTFKSRENWLMQNRTQTDKQYFINYKSADYLDQIVALHKAFYNYDHDFADQDNKLSDLEYADFETRVSKIMENAYQISETAKSSYNNYKNMIDGKAAEVTNNVSAISASINSNVSAIGNITSAIDNANSKSDEVITAVRKLNGKLDEWNSSITKYGSNDSFQQSMLQEWKNQKSSFDIPQIEAVSNRLQEDKSNLNSIMSELAKFSYAGTSLTNITNVNTAKNSLKARVNSSAGSKSEADSIFENKQLFIEGRLPDNSIKLLTDNPKLKFYNYLQITFGAQPTENDKHEDTASKNLIEDVNQKANEPEQYDSSIKLTTEKKTEGDPFSYLPSDSKGSGNVSGPTPKVEQKSTKEFKQQTGIVSNLLGALKNIGLESRDNLYVMEYAMGMFSDNASEAELAVKNKNNKEAEKAQLKTLSGIPINETNNYLYGSEIEYILYGNKDGKENVSLAKKNIFAVRFICNSIYALTNGEIKMMTLPPATAISAATMGVVPIPVIQTVLKLAMALAETTVDMKKMSDGKKVAIFKDKNSWSLSVTNTTSLVVGNIQTTVGNGIDKAAGKADETLQNLIDSTGDKAKDMTDELQQSIVNATQSKLEDIANLMLAQYSETIGSMLINATKEIDGSVDSKLNDTNAYVDSIFNEANEQMNTLIKEEKNDLFKQVKQWVYDNIILKQTDTYKKEVVDALEKIKTDTQNSVDKVPEKAYEYVKTSVDKITSSLMSQVDIARTYVKGIVNTQVDQITSDLKAAASQGVDKAKDAMLDVTDKYLSRLGDSIPIGQGEPLSASKPSAIKSMLSFNYSDYLRLFMFIKLYNNETTVKRIADLVQINITSAKDKSVLHHEKGKDFRMSSAYTYVSIDTKLGFKTLFLNIPFINSYVKKDGVDYFKFNYKSVLGY